MTLKKFILLIIFMALYSFTLNSYAEDIDPISSIINKSVQVESSQDTLPDSYDESVEDEKSAERYFSLPQNSIKVKRLSSGEESKINSEDNSSIKSPKYIDTKAARIIALNKITAKSQSMIIKVGEASFFGNIEIKVHRCVKSTDLYKPENKILLSVVENKVDEDQFLLFQGWMMSSNIAASTFEHAIFDIFSEECL